MLRWCLARLHVIEWFQWLHAVKKHMGGDVVVLRIKFDPADSIESTCEARLSNIACDPEQ